MFVDFIPLLWSPTLHVISKALGSDTAYKWESSGADGYTIQPWERRRRYGSDLKIKKIPRNFDNMEEFHLRSIIKVPDFIHPRKME